MSVNPRDAEIICVTGDTKQQQGTAKRKNKKGENMAEEKCGFGCKLAKAKNKIVSSASNAYNAYNEYKTTNDTVYLAKTRSITIKAIDSNGGQFIPAFTTYLGEQEVMKSTDNGTVTYNNVEDGVYSVIISSSGYYQVTREIEVSGK